MHCIKLQKSTKTSERNSIKMTRQEKKFMCSKYWYLLMVINWWRWHRFPHWKSIRKCFEEIQHFDNITVVMFLFFFYFWNIKLCLSNRGSKWNGQKTQNDLWKITFRNAFLWHDDIEMKWNEITQMILKRMVNKFMYSNRFQKPFHLRRTITTTHWYKIR